MARKSSKKKSGGVSTIICLLIIVGFFTSCSNKCSSSDKDSVSSVQSTGAISSEVSEDSTSSTQSTSTTSSNAIESIDQEVTQEESGVNADLALITADGHPRYYGSTEQAHKVWDGATAGKIVFADSFSSYSDKTIIYMDGYSQSEDNEIIRTIEVYFNNFTRPIDISLDETLDIVDGYIPHDIIEKWYEYSSSYCLEPIEKNDDGKTYYVVSYHLTDAGKKATPPYSGTMDIIINTDRDGSVNDFTIRFGTPQWMSSLELNGYKQVEWEYDFCPQSAKAKIEDQSPESNNGNTKAENEGTETESDSTKSENENSEITVYYTDTGSKYHNEGCRTLKSKHETTLKKAKAMGLKPCGVCNPPQ